MKTLLIYYITLGASSKNRSPLTIWYLTFAVVNTIHKYRLKNQNNNPHTIPRMIIPLPSGPK